jgi:hypothetical protein
MRISDFKNFAEGGRYAGESFMVELRDGAFLGAQLDADGSVMIMQTVDPADVVELRKQKQIATETHEWPPWADRATADVTREDVERALEQRVIVKVFAPPLPCLITTQIGIEDEHVVIVYEGLGGREFALHIAPEDVRMVTRLHRGALKG